MTHNQPAFYAIIPANVRYSKTVEMGAKLLYGEITSLTNSTGFCWATNKYFCDVFAVSEATVKRWIKSLKDSGFIFLEVYKAKVGETLQNHRKIWISEEVKEMFETAQKRAGVGSKMSWGGFENEPYNTKDNTKEEYRKEAAPPPPPLFRYGKGDRIQMPVDAYNKLVNEFGLPKIKEYLDRLDEYADINPKKFKAYGAHDAVIRCWMRRDQNTKAPAASASASAPVEKKSIAARLEGKYTFDRRFGNFDIYGPMGLLVSFAKNDEEGIERWLNDRGL